MAGDVIRIEKELQLLKTIILSIAQAKDFHEALDICLRQICEITGWSYGEVWLLSQDNKTIYISNIYYGKHDELKEFYDESRQMIFTRETGLPGLVWKSGQPVWVKELSSDSRFIRAPLALQFNLKSALGIPIIVDNETVSVLVFFMFDADKDDVVVDLLLTIVAELGLFFKRWYLDERLRKVNRALRVLSDSNQAIIRATDELQLFNSICKIAVDSGGYRMALVAFAEHDEHKSIKIVAYAGFNKDYIEQLKLTWADTGVEGGISSRVIRTGKPFLVTNISNDPVFSQWREAAIHAGYGSAISFPLIINDNVIGVFNMYASEPDAFDTGEEKLLEELANDLAFGILSLRKAGENKRLQAQLFQAQKMEAIGQVASGIAHDFNNMLTAVIGYANILYGKLKENEPLKYNVEQILTASEKAAGLVQNLLTFGRKQDTGLTLLDLNKTIMNISGLLQKLLGDLVVYKTGLTSGQISIMGNKTHLEQVLMNLAGNANDAMPGGGILTISTDTIDIDEQFIKAHGYGRIGRFAAISVQDTGSGMNTMTIEKIYEPFFTTKPVGKGTGLGLSVVYGIVKQHKGYIDVTSAFGKGTTFNIYLPLV